MNRSICKPTIVVALTLVAFASCGPNQSQDVVKVSSGIICGVDNRNPVTTLAFPNGAVGSLSVGCSGTMISPFKVLTASHCVESLSPSQISFSPQFGIVTSGTGPAPSVPNRITQGRDPGDTEMYADWAILSFANNFSTQLGANYQQMSRANSGVPPFGITLIGYAADRFSSQPGFEACTINTIANWDGNTLVHGCDVIGGASGGPLFASSGGGNAWIFGVQSAHGSGNCSGQTGNTASNGKYFYLAPDNTGGVALAYTGNGRMAVYASDLDWDLIAHRVKVTTDPGSNWLAWDALDAAFTPRGKRMAAVNIADNRQQVWAVTLGGQLQTKWQFAVDGSWSSWNVMSTPTDVKDVSASGGNGITTHVFTLGTDNVVRVASKLGDASSNWSSWTSLGTASGATALSAVAFSGLHQVFVVSPSGAQTTWGNGTSFGQLLSFDTVSGGFVSVAAGVLQDGRVNVVASSASGVLDSRTRALDGSSWTPWTAMPQANPARASGFTAMTTGRSTDGREQVVAVGTDGNIYTIWEVSGGSFSGSWVRFYK
jgi:V8-like Glu-specific endopeptidase